MGRTSRNSAKTAAPILIALGLAVATAIAFGEVGSFGYVSYDDPRYVIDNVHVRSGWSLANTVWAFRTLSFANWHPLTWLSLMLDEQLFGNSAAAHHWVNVVLHVANAILLFAGLRAFTGALWRSALVAALFALHPLHVESVAWISARKDVLSTLFGLLSMGAYCAFARRQSLGEPSARAYAASVACLALGLMAKPMLVTWPLVFLLLDLWPLHRVRFGTGATPARSLASLFAEKTPFLALALVSAVLTIVAQQKAGALSGLAEIPLAARAANAALSAVRYLESTAWPTGLVAIYPHARGEIAWGPAMGAAAALSVATTLALRARETRPALTVGWLFYVVTLLPVIGIVQAGVQARADRYTYVPLIGIFVLVAWALGEAAERARPLARAAIAVACAVAAIACAVVARQQARYWSDSQTLFAHALAHTVGNAVARVHFATALQDQGRCDEAIEHYRAALTLEPDDPYALIGLGNCLLRTGHDGEARSAFQSAIGRGTLLAEAFIGMGNYYMAQRDAPSAYQAFARAVELDPESADALNNAGAALASGGDIRGAIPYFEGALRLRPDHAGAERNLEAARAATGGESGGGR
jgi:protein O-mannosyl-transferase